MEAIFEDAFNLLCGAKLGEGIHRRVFLCKIDPSLVVKVEYETSFWTGSNAAEWRNWEDCQYTPALKRWLAPCVAISPNSRVLLQKRTTNIPAHMTPTKLPRFLTDTKWENFGMLNGKIVAHDYPTLIMTSSTQLRKVDMS